MGLLGDRRYRIDAGNRQECEDRRQAQAGEAQRGRTRVERGRAEVPKVPAFDNDHNCHRGDEHCLANHQDADQQRGELDVVVIQVTDEENREDPTADPGPGSGRQMEVRQQRVEERRERGRVQGRYHDIRRDHDPAEPQTNTWVCRFAEPRGAAASRGPAVVHDGEADGGPDPTAVDPDDSWRVVASSDANGRECQLDPSYRMEWVVPPELTATRPVLLQFKVSDSEGRPAKLESYLG